MPQQPSPTVPPIRRAPDAEAPPTTSSPPTPAATTTNNTQTRNQTQDQDHYDDHVESLLAYLGIGRHAIQKRKALAVLAWSIFWSLAQITVIVTIVILSGVVFKNTQHPGSPEWSACDRPLGIWACLWIVRVLLSTSLSYWEYKRELDAIQNYILGAPTVVRRGNRTNTIPRADRRQLQPIRLQGIIVPQPNPAYTRLSVLCSLLTLSWFLTAHILEYTSINTCRHTAPHLWWLVFGILCIMYLMVFEVVVIGFIVLVITPIVFVFWNILLICLGRHPIQNPHIIKPEIDKIPKTLVEKIPLVMYIPPPPEGSDLQATSSKIITNPHTYPPKSATTPPVKSKPRFRFLKPKGLKAKESSKNPNAMSADVEKNPGTGRPLTWTDYWEESEYPFVVLEGNRAACAICLMDFEEPKRKPRLDGSGPSGKDDKDIKGETTAKPADDGAAGKDETVEMEKESNDTEANQSPDSGITLEARAEGSSGLHLEDAGEEAQPLRLLTCGHVFHKTCLDPWLTDVSGRCPVCQRPVEIPGQKTKKSRDRTQNPTPT